MNLPGNSPGFILLDLKTFLDNKDKALLEYLVSWAQIKKEKEEQVLDSIPSLVWVVDREGTIICANKSFADFWGKEKNKLLGKKITGLSGLGEKDILWEKLEDVYLGAKEVRFEEKLSSTAGEERWMDITLSPLYAEGGEIRGVTFIASDITQRKDREEELKHLSMHDSLTGLYNRFYFEEEMERLNNERHYPLSIIVCDVDGLKMINDILGHEKGDELLKRAAEIIKIPFRTSDVVSRVGGDEFAVILPSTNEETVKEIVGRLLKTVESYNKNKAGLPISLSIGYATGTHPGVQIIDIFRQADNNMYQEKYQRGPAVKKMIYDSLLEILARKDFQDKGLIERLQSYVILLGQAVGLSPDEIENLKLFSLVHDIGKVSIDSRIISKKEALSSSEWEEIKRHPEIGYRIALSLPKLAHVAELILQHHEWWNGRGYPQGLEGRDIHLYARILAVVDAYFAMTSPRPYRPPLSHEEAMRELRRCRGIQFDPRVVDIFEALIEQEYLM